MSAVVGNAITTSLAPGSVSPHLAAMTPEDERALRAAVAALEHPSLAARLSNLVGRPVELIGYALPAAATQAITRATSKGLEAALAAALRTMRASTDPRSWLMHRAAATAVGAAGGAFGLAALPVELPLSTVIMLRAIAAIAREEGEDLSDPEATLACLQVFALGGRGGSDDAAESGYFAVRGLLAKSVSEAARYIAERGLAAEGSPVLVRFIAMIASRFGVVVTQKVAAQAVPIVGALGGAGVNYAFMDHFQAVARGHFTVRRLERSYGKDTVRGRYEQLAGEAAPAGA
ncbi:MAG: EcsC family protein [Hyphomicrobiales bacterium]|nr:EcsC family protein [Hyphomicrobiales bacterium]